VWQGYRALRTQVVTHPGTSGSGRYLISVTLPTIRSKQQYIIIFITTITILIKIKHKKQIVEIDIKYFFICRKKLEFLKSQ